MTLKEITCWDRRYLVLNLVMRNLKLRYRNSWLGALWTLLLPAGSALVYYFVFSLVLKVQTPHFLAFVLLGTLCWTFVSSSTLSATDTLVQNRSLLNKVAMPPQALVYAEIITCLINFLCAIPIIAVVFIATGVPIGYQAFLLPLIFIILTGQLVGLGLILGIGHAFFRDFKHMMIIIIQIWFYLTPVLYGLDRWPEKYFWLTYLNPIAFVFDEIHKAALHLGSPDWSHLGVSLAWTFALLVPGTLLLVAQRQRMIEQL